MDSWWSLATTERRADARESVLVFEQYRYRRIDSSVVSETELATITEECDSGQRNEQNGQDNVAATRVADPVILRRYTACREPGSSKNTDNAYDYWKGAGLPTTVPPNVGTKSTSTPDSTRRQRAQRKKPLLSVTQGRRKQRKRAIKEESVGWYCELYRRIPPAATTAIMAAQFSDQELRVIMNQNQTPINNYDNESASYIELTKLQKIEAVLAMQRNSSLHPPSLLSLASRACSKFDVLGGQDP